MTKQHTSLNAALLGKFTGTLHWYRHPLFRSVIYTDGVKYVADEGQAYWLIDEIAAAVIGEPCVSAEPFQVWTLKVAPNYSAVLSCEDGNYNLVYVKNIDFTDFPLEEITLWYSNNTILLPNEW